MNEDRRVFRCRLTYSGDSNRKGRRSIQVKFLDPFDREIAIFERFESPFSIHHRFCTEDKLMQPEGPGKFLSYFSLIG